MTKETKMLIPGLVVSLTILVSRLGCRQTLPQHGPHQPIPVNIANTSAPR